MIDRSRDPFYYGDVRVMIFNVPLKTDNNQTEVSHPKAVSSQCAFFVFAPDSSIKVALLPRLFDEAK